jgi:hypothetical protein
MIYNSFVGEFSNLVWVPLSEFLNQKCIKIQLGGIGGIISFFEEFFPFSDIILTFTLMCFYYCKIKKNRINV